MLKHARCDRDSSLLVEHTVQIYFNKWRGGKMCFSMKPYVNEGRKKQPR